MKAKQETTEPHATVTQAACRISTGMSQSRSCSLYSSSKERLLQNLPEPLREPRWHAAQSHALFIHPAKKPPLQNLPEPLREPLTLTLTRRAVSRSVYSSGQRTSASEPCRTNWFYVYRIYTHIQASMYANIPARYKTKMYCWLKNNLISIKWMRPLHVCSYDNNNF